MRIGLTSLYAWRPHVEHTHFLANLARAGGHEVRFLTCDGDLPTCYTRQLRDRPAWRECLQCRVGGIRSYEAQGVAAISDFVQRTPPLPDTASIEWSRSSASTLGRFESDTDFDSGEFRGINASLSPAARMAHDAARQWIVREGLDAVILFNGRMDITRAVFEAARSLGKRVLSHERTWFGDGIQLLPDEHCLGLKTVWQKVSTWRHRPLTESQALKAAALVARRLLKQNRTEWRAYNLQAQPIRWPIPGSRVKALFLPSSTNEIWGHADWQSGWTSPTHAVDAIMARLGLSPADIVMRCHPNWSERIGKRDGRLPEAFYTNWAHERGVHVISSQSTASTMDLIAQCDVLLLQVGSAALEAGVLGKPIITTSPSIYHLGGFTLNVHGPDAANALPTWNDLGPSAFGTPDAIARHTLRFAYTMVYRIPQFTPFVRARQATRYDYVAGASPDRLTRLLESGKLEADDPTHAPDQAGEDRVLDRIFRSDWEGILAAALPTAGELPVHLNRRWPLQAIDRIRAMWPAGDR